jgi:hypothetical protein
MSQHRGFSSLDGQPQIETSGSQEIFLRQVGEPNTTLAAGVAVRIPD